MPRLAEGEMVLASASTVPGFAPCMTPLDPTATSSAMRVSPTHMKTHSICSATSLRRGARERFFVGGELLGFGRGVRPDCDAMTGARQVARHRVAHETQSKKSEICHKREW